MNLEKLKQRKAEEWIREKHPVPANNVGPAQPVALASYLAGFTAAEERYREAVDALAELVDLMEETRHGYYEPDYFTTQPAKTALAKLREAGE